MALADALTSGKKHLYTVPNDVRWFGGPLSKSTKFDPEDSKLELSAVRTVVCTTPPPPQTYHHGVLHSSKQTAQADG